MPEGAISVTRPGKWGNPFKVSDYFDAGYSGNADVAARHCVEAYRAWLLGQRHWAHGRQMPAPPDPSELRGKNLACWCAIGKPCHADVLLEIANALVTSSPEQEEETK
jgi:hypothetical protein